MQKNKPKTTSGSRLWSNPAINTYCLPENKFMYRRQAPSEEAVRPRPLGMELADRPAELPVPVMFNFMTGFLIIGWKEDGHRTQLAQLLDKSPGHGSQNQDVRDSDLNLMEVELKIMESSRPEPVLCSYQVPITS